MQSGEAAEVLADALDALNKAVKAVNRAVAVLADGEVPPERHRAFRRTTGTQVLAVLGRAGGPLSLQDIADRVVAVRRDEDRPKAHGGTRYQEMCRASIVRLIDKGLVERVPPSEPRGRMRFQLSGEG